MLRPELLLFLDFGGGEIIIILLVILIVLGPDKIPAFAKRAGQVIRYIRNATDDIKREIDKETQEIQTPIKSAYKSASSFSENANKAMKATFEDLELIEKKENDKAEKSEKNKKSDEIESNKQ
jgi:Tat protein translocase TatB subunit